MGKRADIEAQIAKLQKDLDGADEDQDYEIQVEKDGTRTTLRGPAAESWLKKVGILEDESAGDGDPNGDGDASKGDPPPVKKGYFR